MAISQTELRSSQDSGVLCSQKSATPYAFWLTIIIFLMSLAVSTLTPPFQSPDEDAHLKRAYLLSHGYVWLSHPAGESTGGLINQGLIRYIDKFKGLPFHGEQKVSANDLYEAKQITWQQVNVHSSTAGISYYFPLLYLPQALGIRIGELLGISVEHSYRLAKLAALIAASTLFYWALRLFHFSAIPLALFILPMSLFQMGAASLDGIAHACCLLAIAIFLKLTQSNLPTSKWLSVIFCFLVALLATSRMQLIPLLLLIFLTYKSTQQKIFLWGGITATLFTISWISLTVLLVVDLRVETGLSPFALILFYATHPIALVSVLTNTLTSISTLKSYATAFIGVLGWLDASLPKNEYAILGCLILVLAIIHLSWRSKSIIRRNQWALLACSLASVMIIFLSLLVQWTPHPATIILGVQGRYFFGSVLMLSIAFSSPTIEQPIKQFISLITLLILASCSLVFTINLLLQRYYLVPDHPVHKTSSTVWSKSLSATESVDLVLSAYQRNTPAKLQGISIFINKPHSKGVAKLELSTESGIQHQMEFTYTPDMKSGYLYFSIPTYRFNAAKLIGVAGDGLQIKTVRTDDGLQRSCLIYELNDGSRRYTPGCP